MGEKVHTSLVGCQNLWSRKTNFLVELSSNSVKERFFETRLVDPLQPLNKIRCSGDDVASGHAPSLVCIHKVPCPFSRSLKISLLFQNFITKRFILTQ